MVALMAQHSVLLDGLGWVRRVLVRFFRVIREDGGGAATTCTLGFLAGTIPVNPKPMALAIEESALLVLGSIRSPKKTGSVFLSVDEMADTLELSVWVSSLSPAR